MFKQVTNNLHEYFFNVFNAWIIYEQIKWIKNYIKYLYREE